MTVDPFGNDNTGENGKPGPPGPKGEKEIQVDLPRT